LESYYGKLAKLETTEQPGQIAVLLILPTRGDNP
jgi:hypothetical protein